MTNKYVLNGINGETGQYLVEPLELDQLVSLALGEEVKPSITGWLAAVWRKIRTPFMGLPLGVDPKDVSQAGWGIVFLQDEDPAVKAALEPLIEHRRKQINNDTVVKVLDYQPGEDWEGWLARYGAAPGSVLPDKVPFYLLLVGDPQKMPFDFGQLLDVEYSVGRLHFDTPEEYSTYAQSVIDYETADAVPNARETVFFSPRHSFDLATQMSADSLVNPLADGKPASAGQPAEPGVAARWGYQQRKVWGQEATRQALFDIVCPPQGTKPPAFVFTASHGMGFPRGSVHQKPAQGAILCQDWPGFGNIQPAHYLTAADVPAGARVHGAVIFHFACYGGGTPDYDHFFHQPNKAVPQIADAPFISALPKHWLAHPGGGALACIGHVERAWGYSIIAPEAGPQIQPFQNAIGMILTGHPLGYALKDFNERYAALSTGLATMLKKSQVSKTLDNEAYVTTWVQRNDAEGYMLLGDPAVRLRVEDLESQ